MNIYTYATTSSPCVAGSYFSSNTLSVVNCCSTNLCNTGTATDTTGYPLCYIGSTATAASCSNGTCYFTLYRHSFIINHSLNSKTATLTASGTDAYMCSSASSCTVGGTGTYNGLAYVVGQCCTTSYCNNSTSVYTATTTTTSSSVAKSSASRLFLQQKSLIPLSFVFILTIF